MFDITLSHSAWFIPLVILVSAGLGWWMYRDVKSYDIPKLLHYLLPSLRGLTLFFTLLLLLEPIISSITEERTPPLVVVLLDNSESIKAHKDSTFVLKEFPNLLKQFQDKLKTDEIRVLYYSFGDKVEPQDPANIQLTYNIAGTNISNAIEFIQERHANQNLQSIVLVSDGIYTTGFNPLNTTEALTGISFFTALVGDTTAPKDLLIKNVGYNDISFLNTKTPLQVNIQNIGFVNQSVEVSLSNKGKLLDKKTILVPNNGIINTEFTVLLEQTGIQQYDISISQINGEISYQNNYFPVFIKVLENRLKIALFAGGPHPDIAALEKACTNGNKFVFLDYTRKSESDFYKNIDDNELRSIDLFLFHNFPSSVNDRPILDKIYAEIERRKVPIAQFIGGASRVNVHPQQANYMALVTDYVANSGSETFLYPTPAYKSHSTWRFKDEAKFNSWLETAPPLLRNDGEWQPKPGALVFGKAKIKGISLDYPVFAILENNGQKIFTFIGENFWRYRVHDYLKNESFELFDEWFFNMFQWLTTRNDNRKFKVYPDKNFYTATDLINFKGQVYDDNMQPVSDAEIKLIIQSPDGKKTDYFLTQNQAGSYNLELSNFEQGTYSYTAFGVKNGKNLGEDKGDFSVGKSAVEFLQLKADENLMRQLAIRTNGKFTFGRQFPILADEILKQPNMKYLLDYKKTSISINRVLFPLVLIILLLTAEWVLRKRYGMV